MHILDIAQNALAARAPRVEVSIREDLAKDRMVIEVKDNGLGIPPEILPRVTDPFVTTRKTREVGLGLSLLRSAAERCGGSLQIQSKPGKGTEVVASFQLDHIDRPPLGDMGETMGVLISGNPEVDFCYHHEVDGQTYSLETQKMREILGTASLDHPAVLAFVRQDVREGLDRIGADRFPKIMEVLR